MFATLARRCLSAPDLVRETQSLQYTTFSTSFTVLICFPSGFHIGDGVNFFGDVKEWSGPFFDTHQLGVRLNFDVDVKKAAVDVKKTRKTPTFV